MTSLFFDNLNNISWDHLPWQDIQLYVFKLQAQIYKKARNNSTIKVKELQEVLLKDYSASLLSIYIVTNYKFIKKKLIAQIFLFLA